MTYTRPGATSGYFSFFVSRNVGNSAGNFHVLQFPSDTANVIASASHSIVGDLSQLTVEFV
ncbi:MAG: hypothetical protein HQL70_03450 [Magnetococcales bacterium]|nr:hypothetical protein [Magnetococcales bacterium]